MAVPLRANPLESGPAWYRLIFHCLSGTPGRCVMKQGIHAMAIAIAVSFTGPAQAQTTSTSPFQIVEASIDDIHTAFRSGRLTARQLVQGYLDRINA